MGEVKLDVGELFGALGDQLRLNALTAGLACVLLVGGNLALDQFGDKGSNTLGGILSVVLEIYVTRSALARGGALMGRPRGRLWSFVGMSIITTIAVALGCILLIVPGLFLAARWFIAAPIIFAEDQSAGASMRESWERTRASTWHLVVAIFLLFGVGYGAAFVPYFVYGAANPSAMATIVSYVFLFGTTVCTWLMAVGAYERLSNRQQALEEVFA